MKPVRSLDADADRMPRRVAAIVAVFANALFLFALDRLMPPRAMAAARAPRPPAGDVLLVRLIDAVPAVPSAASDEPPPRIEPPPRETAAPVAAPDRRVRAAHPVPRGQGSAQMETARSGAPVTNAPVAATALNLFDPTGRVRVPAAVADVASAGEAFPLRPREPAPNFLVHAPILPYAPTRFEPYFPSVRETLGREVIRKTTASHVWRTPWGTQIGCAFNPLLPMTLFGCGWGFAPRATIDELRAMRVELPSLKGTSSDPAPPPGAPMP